MEKLKEFQGCFDSDDIKDADAFEGKAVDFRNWFVNIKYQDIQPNFDNVYSIVKKIAKHYRPKVQSSGCDCLYILMQEAAPAQIFNIREDLQKIYDKLIQIGHSDVIPSLMPAISTKFEIVFKYTEEQKFHTFMLHLIETWNREGTAASSAYVMATEFQKMIPHIGMAITRYITPCIQVINHRMKNNKSRNHIRQYMACVKLISEQAWPVLKASQQLLNESINIAKENVGEDSVVLELCDGIVKLIDQAPEVPLPPQK